MGIAHNTTKETKQCSKCLKFLPKSTTYFYRVWDGKTYSKELRDFCKDCTPKRGRKTNSFNDVLNKYVVDKNGCWAYTGKIEKNGYGAFYYRQSTYKAHRVAYEILVGPIPDKLVLDHLCKNKSCINPSHLEPVSQKENARRWFDGLHCPGCQCEVK